MMIALTPAAMAGFERLAHHCDVAGAVERVVGAADLVGARFVRLTRCGTRSPPTSFGLTKCVMPKRSPQALRAGVDVDADDHVGAGEPQALDHVEPDAAEAEHDRLGARLDLRGVDHGADAGRDAAADVADLVERRVLADLRDRDLGQHREVRERRAAHVVVELACLPSEKRLVPSGITPLPCVARIAVQRLVLRDRHDLHCAAFGRVERDDVIARLDAT